MKNIQDEILKGRFAHKPFSARAVSELFGVSRQYVHRILSELVTEKKLVKIGATKSARYASFDFVKSNPEKIPTEYHKRFLNKNLEEHRVLLEIEEKFWPLSQFEENVRSIITFAFSEMFNNAIEHSASRYIHVALSFSNKTFTFVVEDAGIGVFKNIMQKRNLASPTEAIQDLLKGKTTTMPRSHSGEGIFFTSRIADVFRLSSYGKELLVTPTDTQIVEASGSKRGTRVTFSIAVDTDRHLTDVFRKYTNLSEESDFGFDKTEIRVKLYVTGGVYISRSQARRILSGLEKFSVIVFDYDQVPVLGQAFADEIYRVFQASHPLIRIENENVSEGVAFMIERAKTEARRRRV